MIQPTVNCPQCAQPLPDTGSFCPFCGARRLDVDTSEAIRSQIAAQARREISALVTDQKGLVRSLADDVEDVVWKRLNRYSWITGIAASAVLAIVGFLGVKTFADLYLKIRPLVAAAQSKAALANASANAAASKSQNLQDSLTQLSGEIEKQRSRLSGSGDIPQRLAELESKANELRVADRRFQDQSFAQLARIEEMNKSLETRVNQVAKQMDTATVRQTFPSIGQERFVTLNGQPWKGIKAKPTGEIWVNVGVFPTSLGDFTQHQMESLVSRLKGAGTVPILGSFGVGGPYFSGFGPIGGPSDPREPVVIYFKQSMAPKAATVAEIVGRVLGTGPAKTFYAAPQNMENGDYRFVAESSGIDVQVYLSSAHR